MIGSTLNGRYRVLDLIGSGGFADVYLCRDLETNVVVAIKVLHAHLARDGDLLARFRGEAEKARELHDPHIVSVLGSGTDNGHHYIVMSYIDGRTLSELFEAQGVMRVDVVVDYADQSLIALEVAHKAGIFHRDIKPQNLMVNARGVLMVMDFGIAKQLDDQHLTPTNVYVGTAGYMAPEQIIGDREHVDGRVDLYALGATLYELLAGTKPFKGESVIQTLHLQLQSEPRPLKEFRSDLPLGLDDIILRCLKRNPDDRFPTAGAMRAALAPYLQPPSHAVAHSFMPETVAATHSAGSAPFMRTAAARLVTGESRMPGGYRRLAAVAVLVGALAAAGVFGALQITRTGAPAAQPELTSPTSQSAVQATPSARSSVESVEPAPTEFVLTAKPSAPIPTPSSEQQLEAAQAALGSGRYQEAISTLTSLRQLDPGNAAVSDRLFRAHLSYGAVLLQANDSDGSEAQYAAALQLKPGDPEALNGQRQVLLARDWDKMNGAWGKDDATALSAAEEIYRLDPGYRQIRDKLYALLISRADQLLGAGDRNGALPVLLEALDLSPESGAAQVRLADYTPTPLATAPVETPAPPAPVLRAPAPTQRPAPPRIVPTPRPLTP